MANIIVTQYIGLFQRSGDGMAQAPSGILSAEAVAIGVASAQSAAVADGCGLIRIYAEADCTVSIGADPTATVANHVPLSAGAEYYHALPPNSGDKVAVIERTVA